MAVRVEKPAFNLRSKLNQLDYDRVPYEKMPPGSIIQVVDHKANNSPTKTGSSYETIAGCTIFVTPKFYNSKIFLSWDFGTEQNGSLAGIAFRVYRNVNGTDTLLKTQDQLTYSTQSGWANAAGGVNITYIDTPFTTAKITYFLQWHVESSGTLYLNYDDGSVAKNGIAAQAMEIRQ